MSIKNPGTVWFFFGSLVRVLEFGVTLVKIQYIDEPHIKPMIVDSELLEPVGE